MPRSPQVVHLDELAAIPGPGSLTWHSVRATLGLRAFGTNAYSAQHVGDDVVEPSAWEWHMRAGPLVASDPERARAIVDDGLAARPDRPGLKIQLARLELAAGREDEARRLVGEAVARQAEAEELVREYPELAGLLA